MKATNMWQEEKKDIWQMCIHHPFVKSLADGTLAEEKFRYYLLQDAYYLKHFICIIEQSKSQTCDPAILSKIEQTLKRLEASELAMRQNFYPRVGLMEQDFHSICPSPTAYHYTSHLYRMATWQHFGITMAALLSCYALYLDIGQFYKAHPSPNPLYQELLATYTLPAYHEAVLFQKGLVDQEAEKVTVTERQRMKQSFTISAELEYEFFSMAYQKQSWRGVK